MHGAAGGRDDLGQRLRLVERLRDGLGDAGQRLELGRRAGASGRRGARSRSPARPATRSSRAARPRRRATPAARRCARSWRRRGARARSRIGTASSDSNRSSSRSGEALEARVGARVGGDRDRLALARGVARQALARAHPRQRRGRRRGGCRTRPAARARRPAGRTRRRSRRPPRARGRRRGRRCAVTSARSSEAVTAAIVSESSRTCRTARSTSARILVAGGCAPPAHPPAVSRSAPAVTSTACSVTASSRHGHRRCSALIAVHSSESEGSVSIATSGSMTVDARQTRVRRARSPEHSFAPRRRRAGQLEAVCYRGDRGPGHEHPARRAWRRRPVEHDHAGLRRGRLDVDAARLARRRLGHALTARALPAPFKARP